MGYVYNRDTDDMEWTDEGDQPLSPVEQAYQNGGQPAQDNLLRAANEYYGGPGSGQPVNTAEHQGTNWYDPNTYQWLINSSTPGQPGPVIEPPPPKPPPPPGPGGSSGGGGGPFAWPQFHAPALPDIAPFSFESYRAPDPFTYEGFNAPTKEDAANEPGYQFGVEEGLGAMKAALSKMGTFRTGATPKAFFNWANRAAEQNYGNVYNRATNTYTLNRNNAFENWGANETARAQTYDRNFKTASTGYGLNLDKDFGLYDRDLQGKLAEFNPQFRSAELTFDDMFRRYKAQLDATTSVATAGAGI